jgi:hypothetical protein
MCASPCRFGVVLAGVAVSDLSGCGALMQLQDPCADSASVALPVAMGGEGVSGLDLAGLTTLVSYSFEAAR